MSVTVGTGGYGTIDTDMSEQQNEQRVGRRALDEDDVRCMKTTHEPEDEALAVECSCGEF